jgi:hypothetical protein
VDDGLFEDDLVEGELGAEKRADLQASDDAVNVGERNLGGGLAAMHGDAAYVGLQAKGSGMDTADFDAAAGDALQFRDEPTANERLERASVDVDEQAESGEEGGPGEEKQIFPPAAAGGLRGRFTHCD